MINYKEISKSSAKLTSTIKKEIAVIEELLSVQNGLKDSIEVYTNEISKAFSNNEVFKNMLLASTEAASLQLSINIKDLENLNNILDIVLTNKSAKEEDIEQYNVLFSKTEKNINLVNEIMQKTKNSFEQLSNVSESELESSNTVEDSGNTKTSNKGKKEPVNPKVPRNIKKVSDDSSDLLCFFPKTDNDILAISTIQDTYQITFNENTATICIEEEDFYFTLKTVGVQISNESNVLLVSRKSSGFFVITNMVIDVPHFINVSKITRNKTFVEFEIDNTSLNVSVKDNELTFLENSESLKNIPKTVSSISTKTVEENANNSETLEQKNNTDSSIDLLKDNNTLIISEKDNQVILPYTIEEVENLYQKKKKKYSSVQDLIKNEYIISAENFKNPIKSRFREAYQLIKKKEHGHLKEAIDLGFELMFQSNLNPAIIAACKNLKELDIYLDCLDDNELDKFSCFNIVYNVPPSTKK